MFKQIIAILALVAYANADCRQLTFDSCGVGIDPPFEQTKGLSIVLCEKFCNQIYGDVCETFTYNKKDSTCELYAVEPIDFANSCNVVGGSVDVDPFDCATTADDCAVSFFGLVLFEILHLHLLLVVHGRILYLQWRVFGRSFARH